MIGQSRLLRLISAASRFVGKGNRCKIVRVELTGLCGVSFETGGKIGYKRGCLWLDRRTTCDARSRPGPDRNEIAWTDLDKSSNCLPDNEHEWALYLAKMTG